MAEDRSFLSTLVVERARQVASGLTSREGHGASIVRATREVVEGFALKAGSIGAANVSNPTEERVRVRELQRLEQQTNVLYNIASLYAGDVGRMDLPVGLLYLVDELIKDLLPDGADPIVHLDQRNMYSTNPIFNAIPTIIDPASQPLPHPVAFNVPALDPGNALFAPILAHEVAHTCYQRGVVAQLARELDTAGIQNELHRAVAAGHAPKEVGERFGQWLMEMTCDAIAATLTGPSFLFASIVFLPAVGEAVLGTHPYPRDRVGLTLRILDQFSWTPLMQEVAGETFTWCRELAANPELDGSPLESALRAAMRLAEPAMLKVAEQVTRNRATSARMDDCRHELFEHLRLEIPPAVIGGSPVDLWLLISAGWLHEIQRRSSEGPAALPTIARDDRLNRFLIKSIELAGITHLWSLGDSAAS